VNKKVSIFAHYDIDNCVDEYVFFYLKELKKINTDIVFVSTASLDEATLKELYMICDNVIVRENTGYDFMSYKVGLDSVDLCLYDEVILCNDSVYGPFYPFEDIFTKMQTKSCDFWGITSSHEISFHLQSYFLVFKKQVFLSEVFKGFWQNLKVLESKTEIIQRYEIGLSQQLISHGFRSDVYAMYEASLMQKFIFKLKRVTLQKVIKKFFNLKPKQHNSIVKEFKSFNNTHVFWKELILKAKMPFIKIELLRDNPIQVDIGDYESIIKHISNYDTFLIENHLKRIKKEIEIV